METRGEIPGMSPLTSVAGTAAEVTRHYSPHDPLAMGCLRQAGPGGAPEQGDCLMHTPGRRHEVWMARRPLFDSQVIHNAPQAVSLVARLERYGLRQKQSGDHRLLWGVRVRTGPPTASFTPRVRRLIEAGAAAMNVSV
jgi:hypothetical protein